MSRRDAAGGQITCVRVHSWVIIVVSAGGESVSLQSAEGCPDLKWLWSVSRGVPEFLLTFPESLTTVSALLCFSNGKVPPRKKT